jgi:hypothetical protein
MFHCAILSIDSVDQCSCVHVVSTVQQVSKYLPRSWQATGWHSLPRSFRDIQRQRKALPHHTTEGAEAYILPRLVVSDTVSRVHC